MTSHVALDVEVLRGKQYPQAEDDPNPCSTYVRGAVYSLTTEHVLAEPKSVSVQANSNAPFYNEALTFDVPSDAETVRLFVEVVEITRKSQPTPILYGVLPISLNAHKARWDAVLPLTSVNPLRPSQGTETDQSALHEQSDGSFPTLSLRVQARLVKARDEGVDRDADVVVEPRPFMCSTHQIVPSDCNYAWVNLVCDKRWSDNFCSALISSCRARVTIAVSKPLGKKAGAGVLRKEAGRTFEKGCPVECRSLGDVVLHLWCCRRTHQVLTRLSLSANRYFRGESPLTVTYEKELEYRRYRKERCILLSDICLSALAKSGANALRESLECLWILYATGIDHDVSGRVMLSYDVRAKVQAAEFTEVAAVLLHACLMHLLVPALAFDKCQGMAEDDLRAEPLLAVTEETAFESAHGRVTTSHQRQFTTAWIRFVGPLMDTLTEAEVLKAAKVFKPAVLECQKRMAKGEGDSVRMRMQASGTPFRMKGDGIHIKHLDKLGCRKPKSEVV